MNAISKLIAASRHDRLAILQLYLIDENLGDVLICQLLIQALREQGVPLINFQVMSRESQKQLGLTDAEVVNLGKNTFRMAFSLLLVVRRILGKRTYQFFKPGHTFSTQKGPKKSCFRLLWTSVKLHLEKWIGLKICRIGSSIGPLNPYDQKIEHCRRTVAHYYSARESNSIQYLSTIGMKRVEYFPDLAWLLPVTGQIQSQTAKDTVVISFRGSILGSEDRSYEGARQKILFAAIEKYCESVKPKKIIVAYQVKRDHDFCLEVYRHLKSVNIASEFFSKQLSAEEAKNLYSDADVVLSNRLHVLLLAYSYGAVPIAVIDQKLHGKIAGIFGDAMMSSHIFDFTSTRMIGDITDRADAEKLRQYRFSKNKELIHRELDKIFGFGVRL